MNHLKAYALRNGCDAFMTYADLGAVGYFEKQGFTTELSLPKERYDGYVKVGCHGQEGTYKGWMRWARVDVERVRVVGKGGHRTGGCGGQRWGQYRLVFSYFPCVFVSILSFSHSLATSVTLLCHLSPFLLSLLSVLSLPHLLSSRSCYASLLGRTSQ